MQKLSYQFDAKNILEELGDTPFSDHHAMPGFGCSALVLVSTNGEYNHDYDYPMMPTGTLKDMPYTLGIWDTLGIDMLRSRFMRIDANSHCPMHKDTNPWWSDKHRIHIVVKANPHCVFQTEKRIVHMEEGSCWLLNSRDNYHAAFNGGDTDRIHLVIDVHDSQIEGLE